MATIWTQEDIDELKKAIRSGRLSVSYAGPPARAETFQSLAEMRALLAEMVKQVSGSTSSPPYRVAATKKGLGC